MTALPLSLVFVLLAAPAAEAPPSLPCVQDEARVLTATARKTLEGMCERGAQKGEPEVVLVTRAAGAEADLPTLARDLLGRLRVGERSGGKGVLVLAVPQGAQVHVEPTAALAAALPPERRGTGREAEFKKGFDTGLFWVVVDTMVAASAPAPQPTVNPPAQASPAASVEPSPPPAPRWPSSPFLRLGVALALAGLLGAGLVAALGAMPQTRTGKRRALGKALGVPASLVLLGGVAALYQGSVHHDVTAALTLLALVGGAGVAAQLGLRAYLLGRVRAFRVACPGCGQPMGLLGEKEDDARLDATQRAEERVSGRDWEVWLCPACGREELRGADLEGARKCPKCDARTLQVQRTAERLAPSQEVQGPIQTARTDRSRTHVLEQCANPGCGYRREYALAARAGQEQDWEQGTDLDPR